MKCPRTTQSRRSFALAFPSAAPARNPASPPRSADLSHNKVVVTLETLRARNRAAILQLAGRHGARNVRIFGSVARGEATAASDLDLLVDWEPGRSLLDHVALAQDLEELLGTKVHIGTERSLHWYVREKILREASPL